MEKICRQFSKFKNRDGSTTSPNIQPNLSENSPYKLRSIEELTEEQQTDEKSMKQQSYINHNINYKLDLLDNDEKNEDLNLKSLRYMRSEIEDIKELLDKKQKQLSNKEQRLKLLEMDLESRERNIIQTAQLKVNDNLSEKLKKFDSESKVILKRMKDMHDNLRQKTNAFKDLKDK